MAHGGGVQVGAGGVEVGQRVEAVDAVLLEQGATGTDLVGFSAGTAGVTVSLDSSDLAIGSEFGTDLLNRYIEIKRRDSI